MRVAIHQPNYLPWIGLFHRISQVDRFVFFDDIAMPQGKTWVSRNRVNLKGAATWLTVPSVRAGHRGQRIREVQLDATQDWARKHLGTIAQAYRRAHFYEAFMPRLEAVYRVPHTHLADLNIALVEAVADCLGLRCEFVRGSSRPIDPDLRATARIVEVCKAFGATHYLSGGGCLDFLEPAQFEAQGIRVAIQRFEHPTYAHPSGAFLPAMAAIDALFCAGPDVIRDDFARQSDWSH